jgi:signal transduction histidine kinase/CheY-like chemotaxis protein
MKLTSIRKLNLIVLFLGALIVFVLLMSIYTTSNRKTSEDWVEHTLEVISNSDMLLQDIINQETGVRGYLITKNEVFLEPYYSSFLNIKIHFNKLSKLTVDNLEQQKRLDNLSILINKRIDLSNRVITQIRQHNLTAAGAITETEHAKYIGDQVRILFKEINKTEYELLKKRRLANEVNDSKTDLLFLILSLISIVVLVSSFFITRKNQINSKLAEEENHSFKLNAIQLTADKLIAEESARQSQILVGAKQQFLSTMSHEIRTPLNSILGFTNVLLKTDLSEKQKEFIQAIKTSGDSLIFLINDILDLAKVNAGKMTFEKKPFQIKKSITLIQNSFDLIIKEKNLEIVNEYDNNIPVMLVGDSNRFNQIFLNLMSNAVKFTHKGKITISIKLLSEDEVNATIEFAITDTGIGIAENKINLIFNVFEQAETGTSILYGGSGLGLSIVKKLVESQGGSIGLKSKEGEGTTFSFILPFEKTKMNIETKTEPKIIKLDSEIKNMRVLVAEDVVLNQLLIKMILSDFGFEHEVVANGKIAIEKLQTNTYDIVLMDLSMPEMNGFEATKYIRNILKSNIPIIALTADVTITDVTKCKESGMNDYISKPIDEELLYSKMVELIKKKQL